ncbi:MAG: tyrosine-type recombinase/integrase [Pseudolabrys sp.]
MLRTKSGLPKHCSWNTDRHGKRRVRFRKHGFTTYITGTPWSEEFMFRYAAAIDGVKEQRAEIGASRTIAGSFDSLCISYYKSPEFRGLRESTQAVRRNIIERFRAEHGTKPLKGLHRKHIQQIIGDKAQTPEAANNLLKVLRVVLNYAVSIDMMSNNPAASVKMYKNRSDGFHAWSEEEVQQFRARHELGSRARLAFKLLLHTGQHRGDIIRMGWQHMASADEIMVKQQKTGTTVFIAIHPELLEALALVPRTNLTFLLTEHGSPFTAAGFGNYFRKQCNAAGLPQCSAHGLRKTYLVRRANAGASTEQLMASGGHKSPSEVARYTREADKRRLARQALELQLRAEGEQKLSNPETRLDKKAAKS